jgi:hypothetical protein
MLCRCQHHVFESSEHVRPDHVSLVGSGEWRDQNLATCRNTQVIGPERHEAFDERTIAGHAGAERGSCFAGGKFNETTARLASFLFVALSLHAQRADGVADRGGRGALGRASDWRAGIELCLQPAAGVRCPLTLSLAGAEAESIERTKRDVHRTAPSADPMLTPALADRRWRLNLRRSQRPEALLRSLGCR